MKFESVSLHARDTLGVFHQARLLRHHHKQASHALCLTVYAELAPYFVQLCYKIWFASWLRVSGWMSGFVSEGFCHISRVIPYYHYYYYCYYYY
jgi:hypothetical protein